MTYAAPVLETSQEKGGALYPRKRVSPANRWHTNLHRAERIALMDLAAAFVAHAGDTGLHGGGGPGGGATTLGDLSDVDLDGIITGADLHFDGSHWIPRLGKNITVLDYGAVMGATSDPDVLTANSEALQAASNVAGFLGGWDVIVPGDLHIDTDLSAVVLSNVLDGITLGGPGFAGGRIYNHGNNFTIDFQGTLANPVRDFSLANIQFDGDASATRVHLNLFNTRHLSAHKVDFWNAKRAFIGDNLWDSEFNFCRFDQLGTSADPNEGCVWLRGVGGVDNRDCNSIRFTNCTFEQNNACDVHIDGTGHAVNKIRFVGCKLECTSGFLRADRVRINGGHSIFFIANDWSLGTPDTGLDGFHAINAVDTKGLLVALNEFEGQAIDPGFDPIASFLRLEDTEHTCLLANDFQASANNNPQVAAIEFVGTNVDVLDFGNGYSYIASGSPAFYEGRPTSLAKGWDFPNIRTVDAAGSHQLDETDELVMVSATAGDVTLLLPPAAKANGPIRIKRYDDGTSGDDVIVDTPDGLAVEGATSLLLEGMESGTFELSGLSWWRTAQVGGDSIAAHLSDTTAHAAANIVVTPFGTIVADDVQAALEEIVAEVTAGAPADATYLTTTANGGLDNEVVVGATPQGEVGGTWGSITVDALHSGSTHADILTVANAYTDGERGEHEAAVDPHPGYQLESTIAELIRDTIAAALVAGTNVSVVVDDAANTITINSTGGSGSVWTTETDATAAFTIDKNVTNATNGGAAVVATLPSAAAYAGQSVIVIKGTAGGQVQVTPPGGATILGGTAPVLLNNLGESVHLTPVGTDWKIL